MLCGRGLMLQSFNSVVVTREPIQGCHVSILAYIVMEKWDVYSMVYIH